MREKGEKIDGPIKKSNLPLATYKMVGQNDEHPKTGTSLVKQVRVASVVAAAKIYAWMARNAMMMVAKEGTSAITAHRPGAGLALPPL